MSCRPRCEYQDMDRLPIVATVEYYLTFTQYDKGSKMCRSNKQLLYLKVSINIKVHDSLVSLCSSVRRARE